MVARGNRFPRGLALLTAAIAGVTGAFGLADAAGASTLFFPREIAESTNAQYNHDCFWGGPRGMDYAALPNPQPIQVPNLYPDKGSTYFVAQLNMPVGSSLTIRGTYPRQRYFSFTVANQLGGGVVGNGDYLRDVQIDPDPGSVNPFRQDPNDRTPTGQTYTLHVLRGPVPAGARLANTIYTTSTSATSPVRLAMRNYIPDQGLGGTGGVDLPTATLTLADGTTITDQAAVCSALNANKTATPTGFPQAIYQNAINTSADPANAPAKPTPVFERFWNNAYTILGAFNDDPLARVTQFPATDDGGYATNPDTQYIAAGVSLNFGKVIVLRVKPPTYARTRPNATAWSPANSQVRYWSACTAQGPVSGKGSDCAYDQQIPVDRDGYWTLVVSRPEDRPANASTLCGAKWLDFGIGEGSYAGARAAVGALYMRYMAAQKGSDWPQSPKNIPQPTTADPYNHLVDVMGEYAPAAHYESRAQYEARGCAGGAPRLAAGSRTPNSGSFGLEWNAVSNALPQLYTLQRQNADGSWSTVATGLTSPSYAFPAGAPESQGTWAYRVGAIDVSSSETAPSEADFGPASDPVEVDRTAPTVSVSCPQAVLLNGVASATTTASDDESGLAVDPSGVTPIDTSHVGPQTTTATAIDEAGNVATASCTTQVQYAYSGLLRPVSPDGSSVFKLGSTVPLKFSLVDAAGLPVSGAVARVYLARVDHDVEGAFVEAVSTSAADSGNAFRETSPGGYQFNLSTRGLTVGTYSVAVVLDDGVSYALRVSLR